MMEKKILENSLTSRNSRNWRGVNCTQYFPEALESKLFANFMTFSYLSITAETLL